MKKTYTKIFYGLLGLCLPLAAGAQCTYPTNIGTIAGSHIVGYTGDGGAGTAAQMNSPYAVLGDATGNVYIADYFNHAVRKVDHSTGIITTVVGTGVSGFSGDGGPASAAQLSGPAGIFLDATGNLFIADKFNERIRKVDASTGIISTVAGNGLHGGFTGAFGNDGPATAASLTYPVAVALDCSGNMYIADNGSQTVRKVGVNDTITEFAGTHYGGYNGDGGPAVAAHLNSPSALAVDCSGNVYIADSWNNRVRKVDAMGVISTVAGNGDSVYSGDGGAATAASLWIPWGITLDACGNLFICDYNNNAVRVVNNTGTISTFAGSNTRGYTGDGGVATASDIYLPSSLAIDGLNNVYIADYGNVVVRYMGTLGYSSRAYAGGTTQSLTVDQNAGPVSVNSLMAIPDAASGLTETWTISRMPEHGTLAGFPAAMTSAGGFTIPTSALTYTPEAGYSGNDEFTILMNDGVTKASTTVSVKVNPAATAVSNTNVAATNNVAFPNPSNGSFKCEFVSETGRDLQLVASDVTGRVVYTQAVHAVAGRNSVSINLPANVQRPAMIMVTLGNSDVKYPVIKMTITE